MCAAFFTMIPGPKMIWQFGELGYDYSINYCINGTINNTCRLDMKPIRWDYLQNTNRKKLYDSYSSLLKLRFHSSYKNGFLTDRVTQNLASGFKWLQVTTDTSNLCLVGNFDVSPVTGQVTFQNAGTWYDYLDNTTITATGSAQNITLQPGEFHLYLNRNINNVTPTAVSNVNNPANTFKFSIYPNPVVDHTRIEVVNKETGSASLELFNETGQKIKEIQLGILTRGIHKINLSANDLNKLASGIYLIRMQIKNQSQTQRLVIFKGN
jgi:hypothetical protein